MKLDRIKTLAQDGVESIVLTKAMFAMLVDECEQKHKNSSNAYYKIPFSVRMGITSELKMYGITIYESINEEL